MECFPTGLLVVHFLKTPSKSEEFLKIDVFYDRQLGFPQKKILSHNTERTLRKIP